MPEATRCPEYAQSGGNAQASSSTSQLVPLTTPSASTLALLSLTQDITALISLSVEATASLLHDWLRSSLASVGLARVQAGRHVSLSRRMGKSKVWGEAGQGLAVVVVGASERMCLLALAALTMYWWATYMSADPQATGQSLCLHLAKSGYTVFPLLPLPSPASPPTSHALSALLLTWSTAQKRLRARYPHHPGSIVPIMTDPERSPYRGGSSARGTGSFAHAGETVRAYLRESGLRLSAVVCASRNREPSAGWNTEVEGEGSESSSEAGHGVEDGWQAESPDMQMIEDFRGTDTSDHGGTQMDGEDEDEEQTQHQQTQSTSMVHPPVQFTRRQQGHQRSLRSTSTSPEAYRNRIPRFRSTGNTGLLASDESTLLSLYRSNVLDPLLIIRELQDLLSGADPYPIGSEINAGSGGKGRVVFVNGPAVVLDRQAGASDTSSRAQGAARIINAARAEATRLLRSELCEVGVTVCEVAVGEFVSDPSAIHISQG